MSLVLGGCCKVLSSLELRMTIGKYDGYRLYLISCMDRYSVYSTYTHLLYLHNPYPNLPGINCIKSCNERSSTYQCCRVQTTRYTSFSANSELSSESPSSDVPFSANSELSSESLSSDILSLKDNLMPRFSRYLTRKSILPPAISI